MQSSMEGGVNEEWAVAEKIYASLLPAMGENGLATDKGLKVMVETLGSAVGKSVDFPPSDWLPTVY